MSVKIAEYRTLPSDEKGLVEKREELILKMEEILNKSKEEKRAFTENENNEFLECKKEVVNIDNTLQAIEETRSLEDKRPIIKDKNKEKRDIEEENFLKFIKGEKRALDISENGGIIPTNIANKIIEKVKELSPIYSMATIYNVSGDLTFPIYDENTSSIAAAYSDDMKELTEGTGKFTTVKLENHIIGCLAKISKSLMNRTDFDLLSFIVEKVAKAISEFLEKELIQGTEKKMQGVTSSTNIITAAKANEVTADELIDVQMQVPEIYQGNACWIMNKETVKFVRKLKDKDGNYLLGTALNGFGFTLLGKPVHFTSSADKMEANKTAIFYGDMSGLYVKLAKNVEIQVLIEKYATEHAIGVVGYVEADSKIVEKQKIAALKMAQA